MSLFKIDPGILLPLVGVRRMPYRFGVLLRHYWLPATKLEYIRTENDEQVQQVVRQMVSCDADACIWRESVGEDERLCTYNRSHQTFRAKRVLETIDFPEDDNEAKNEAFLRMPVLTPLLPIPIGFQWHVRSDNGFMEFTLDSEFVANDMKIVFIRRAGCFLGRKRDGMTAIAVDRSVVLEDRYSDSFDDGTESYSTFKLTKSTLTT